jgi:hypothetical protein
MVNKRIGVDTANFTTSDIQEIQRIIRGKNGKSKIRSFFSRTKELIDEKGGKVAFT